MPEPVATGAPTTAPMALRQRLVRTTRAGDRVRLRSARGHGGSALGVAQTRHARTPLQVRRLEFTTANNPPLAYPILGTVADVALAPDGQTAVVSVTTATGWALAVRKLDQLAARVLPGTENAVYPAFSPDGRWVAFQAADGAIRKIGVDGSPLVTITPPEAADIGGIAWLSNSEIIFPPQAPGAIGMYLVPADGGKPTALTTVDTTARSATSSCPWSSTAGRSWCTPAPRAPPTT